MQNFFTLTPERILDAVEAALDSGQTGVRATGFALALNSIENRVYEVGLDDGTSVVTKFYRPNRWSAEQILEEHAFIKRLHEAEIPVVPPVPLTDSPRSQLAIQGAPCTLARSDDGIFFTVFPKVRARLLDELDDSQVRQIGRLLARLHAIGESPSLGPSLRTKVSVEPFLDRPLEILTASKFLEGNWKTRYEAIVQTLRARIAPMLEKVQAHRLHGDCHPGNILWTPSGAPFFVDFDDMLIGPAVQDLWMVVRGRDANALKQRAELITAYEVFREFDYSQLRLIEPLRAMRLVHYSAWIANRWDDPSFPKLFPDFGSQKYWQDEIGALEEILSLISAPTEDSFNR